MTFLKEIINKIDLIIEANPSISMLKLSREVCEWMNWRGHNGKLKEMSCKKALLELQRRGVVKLPVSDKEYAFQRRRSSITINSEEFCGVCCNIKELGEIEIKLVGNRRDSSLWNEMMERYHYLGKGPLCGAQIRYLVKSSIYGWLGGISFSAGIWSLKERDKWIGWSEGARIENLHKVICNSRFLILPTVEVKNLASHVLSKSIKKLSEDWEKRYGYSPVLVESFVDPERFKGTCYRAANWIHIGDTSGRRDKERGRKKTEGKKQIYVKALQEGWRDIVRVEPEVGIREKGQAINPFDWVEEEFSTTRFYDNRLSGRLIALVRDFYGKIGKPIPEACDGVIAKAKGAYRFFSNNRVEMEKIVMPHIESTVERIKEQEIVLVVQDTTTLNYTAHPATNEVGPINTKEDKATGLILHDTMAFTREGSPLGLVDVQCWARDPDKAGKSEFRKELPIEEKESIKWLKSYRATSEIKRLCSKTRFVVIGDREADIYELFYEKTRDYDKPDLLIRAEKTRNRKEEGIYIWDKMKKKDVAGYKEVLIPRKGNRAERIAKLEIRFSSVTIDPPKQKKGFEPIKVWCVYTHEVDYGKEVNEPIEWMLLTTIEVKSFEEAVEKIVWYSKRWGIEEYHRILKSGCRIEDRRLGNAREIKACLGIDMVVAWRVFYMTKISREKPEAPCTEIFREEEWRVLYSHVKREKPPEKIPGLREIVRMVAKLGGFLGRKGDKEPGVIVIWRGLQYLKTLLEGYTLAMSMVKGP